MNGLDRRRISFRPLTERSNKILAGRDMIDPGEKLSENVLERHGAAIDQTAAQIRRSREVGASVILGFGAHVIKNGLGPVLIRLIEEGYVTHLATNGAGIIHDWELAYLGATSEDVRTNLANGTFGIWEETGYYLNLALAIGAYRGLGYGQAVGAFVQEQALDIPSQDELRKAVEVGMESDEKTTAVAALDLLRLIQENQIASGMVRVEHRWQQLSVQAAAYRHGVVFTGHPMFGHDIMYTHPLSSGAALGICAERDFLRFAAGVQSLTGGVYLSIGSAVMSPMVFEKSLSMARNLEIHQGRTIDGFTIQVVDLATSTWDWANDGEPPETHPDYYLRYMKTFSRAGARTLSYLSLDNRDYLTGLLHCLEGSN